MSDLCVGMFGTCGGSKWREPFKARYAAEGVTFYDPQKPDWNPEDAKEEARHLADDAVILFAITSETYGTGSLAETGFSILQALRLDDRRDFIIQIDSHLDESLKENARAYKESVNARAIVLQHLRKLRLSNVYVVDSLDEMLDVSLSVYRAAEIRVPLQAYNPHNR